MTTTPVERDGRGLDPSFGGSLAYLLMNLPLGVFAFVWLVTLTASGLGTVVVWLGVPLLALLVLSVRGAARLERARVYALLDRFITLPYAALPDGTQRLRWKARLKDVTTWRDLVYLFLLFPLGIVEFVLVTTFWATSLGLAALPIYYRFLPGGVYRFPSDDFVWFTVDSTVGALPWAALGILFAALSVALTKALAGTHARLAAALLGPTSAQRRRLEASWDEAERMSAVGG
ncbi:sensor domain-containing protein [Amycolatopsis sp. H20-H5]|uniref:sensor domain-containing protein n=1 Tax=Amycolatopsis sp. H20-H5 TaxID=3046309 RepID=UPI002DB588EF|nr:sensor domain-containing protein [Amycolatopsis sp. H20-H5]MEC3978950.1 sensor domain-containing protein [Amycolatopsis sp. H20-H5]